MSPGLIVVMVIVLAVVLSRKRRSAHGINLDTATDADIRHLLMGGSKIDAIKVYRRLHGGGLKEAKEAVERIAEQLPRPTGE